jgi:hypothetical protein
MKKWTEQSFFKKEIQMATKEMQIKTSLRFYLTPVRMAIIKNTNKSKVPGGSNL